MKINPGNARGLLVPQGDRPFSFVVYSSEIRDFGLINNMIAATPNTTRVVWNNPMGGALEWNRYPQNAIYDTRANCAGTWSRPASTIRTTSTRPAS